MELLKLDPASAGSLYSELIKEHASQNIKFDAGDVPIIYNALTEAVCRFLAKFKLQDRRVAISINDLNVHNDFIIGFAVDYQAPENEDDEMPGNWTVVASFNKDDILGKAKAKVYTLQDDFFLTEVMSLLYQHSCIQIPLAQTLAVLMTLWFGALKKNLLDATPKTSTHEYGIDCGTFDAIGKMDSDEVTTAIEMHGDLKKIIKDDTSLENIKA